MNPNVSAPAKKSLTHAILFAGLIAGILDGTAAVVSFLAKGGKDPIKIFNFIASGIFGPAGLQGGMPMAFAGLVFHMCIATIWAAIYFFIYPRITCPSKNWVVSGLLYGIFVWIGMNLVVVPLSNTPAMGKTVQGMITGTIILMLFIGLPVAYLASKHFGKSLSEK